MLPTTLTPHKVEAKGSSSKGHDLELSYRQLEALLADRHDIGDEQFSALRGRIKHFQRTGWPGGTNTGKGRPATYDIGAVLRLTIGFELLEVGITPERAVNVLTINWDYVATALSLAFGDDGTDENNFDVIIYFDPSALQTLRPSLVVDEASETFFYTSTTQFARYIKDSPRSDFRRLAMINISGLLRDIADCIEGGWAILSRAYHEWDTVARPTPDPLDSAAVEPKITPSLFP